MRHLRLSLLLLTLSACTNAHAQNEAANAQVLSLFRADTRIAAKVLPNGFAMDGAIAEWEALAPSAPLFASGKPADKRGRVWIAQSDAGIVVAGLMPQQKDSTTAKTHSVSLELAVASIKELTLPPISWSFRTPDPGYYRSAADCTQMTPSDAQYSISECKQWVNEQLKRRAQMSAAFIRQWVLSNAAAANSVFELPRSAELADFQPHAPVAIDFKQRQTSANSGVKERSFELLIPWSALPATDQLRLEVVYLSIAVSTSVLVNPAPPRDFFAIALPSPREFAVTRCHTPVLGVTNGVASHGYFLPNAGVATGEVLAFFNIAPAYPDAPEGIDSPTATGTLHQDTELADGQFLCWPLLAYQDNRRQSPALRPRDDLTGQPIPLLHREDGTLSDAINASAANWADALQWLVIDGGNLLVRQGPAAKDFDGNGAGACGMCARTDLNFWYLDRAAGTFKQIFRAGDVISLQGFMPGTSLPPTIKVSADWRTVTVAPFEAYGELHSLRFCLSKGGQQYDDCAAH